MTEGTAQAPTNRLARVSCHLGVLALVLLVLSGGCMLALAGRSASADESGLGTTKYQLAALAAFVLGFVGLVEIRRDADTVLRVLALLLLVLGGGGILALATLAERSSQWSVIAFAGGMVLCQGLAAIAALAGLVLGIVGLVESPRAAGKAQRKTRAIAGLVTSVLTLLFLTLAYGGAILQAREARKMESANNLKELALAMHLYHECYRRFPPAELRDPALGARAQPYSWRVGLLPALGEENLFAQYRRDEPWDSAANKALLARMPRVFAAPGSKTAADGLTHYQVFVGPGTAFDSQALRISLVDFPRGADQTILMVESANPVYWTKPEDLKYTPDGPWPKLGGLVGNGFHAAFADGTVRWIETQQQDSELRAHASRNGP